MYHTINESVQKSLQSATYAAPRSSSNAFRKLVCVKIQQKHNKTESIFKDIVSSVNVVRG
jgi:aspartate/glutamate racemase